MFTAHVPNQPTAKAALKHPLKHPFQRHTSLTCEMSCNLSTNRNQLWKLCCPLLCGRLSWYHLLLFWEGLTVCPCLLTWIPTDAPVSAPLGAGINFAPAHLALFTVLWMWAFIRLVWAQDKLELVHSLWLAFLKGHTKSRQTNIIKRFVS